jgi:hypothetical protein
MIMGCSRQTKRLRLAEARNKKSPSPESMPFTQKESPIKGNTIFRISQGKC